MAEYAKNGALTLDATPWQMGLLSAAGGAPILLVGLFAGVWVDRVRRRPVMIATDLGRAVLLLIVPLAAVVGALRIEQADSTRHHRSAAWSARRDTRAGPYSAAGLSSRRGSR